MLTFGELITAALSEHLNIGSETVAYSEKHRAQAERLAREIVARVHTLAPYTFKHANSTATLTAGVATLPADFGNFGTKGRVFLSSPAGAELTYMPSDQLEALLQSNPSTGQQPQAYTMKGITALGLQQLKTWPAGSGTLNLVDYAKRIPDLIDVPLAPGVAAVAGPALTGTWAWRVTFVHPSGETEGGFVSRTLALADQKGRITLPVSRARTVTARKLYRPATGPGVQYKLVTSVADNLTTTYDDAIADIALGADVPTPSTAVSGLEQYPSDFHEVVFLRGLVKLLDARKQSAPIELFTSGWEQLVKRMWADVKPGRNALTVMPAYGSMQAGPHRINRRLPT